MSIQKITQKSGVRYRARIRIDGKQATKVFQRKIDAEHWEREQLRHRERPDLRPKEGEGWTLVDLYAKWCEANEGKLGVATFRGYCHNWNKHIKPIFGDAQLDEIAATDLDRWVAHLQDAPLSPRTVNGLLTFIGTLYRWGQRRYSIPPDPTIAVGRLPQSEQAFDFWHTQEEVERFLSRNREHPYYSLFLTALSTGMRFGEMVALQWDCVRFDQQQIVVRQSFCKVEQRLKSTKGKKIRVVPMSAPLLALLAEERLKSSTPWVFPGEDGGMMPYGHFSERVFVPACLHADVPVIRVHDLRHTFASHFMMRGGDIYVLQKLLGHSTIRTTERYAHLSPAHLQRARDIVVFGSESKGEVIKLPVAKK